MDHSLNQFITRNIMAAVTITYFWSAVKLFHVLKCT
jgi:hypothetical protein